MCCEAADDAERQPDPGEHDDQDEVVAGGGHRVQVLRADEEHEDERDDHAPAIELALPHLAKDEEDERRVEEVLGSGHAVMIRGRRVRVVGAGVEQRVDFVSTRLPWKRAVQRPVR